MPGPWGCISTEFGVTSSLLLPHTSVLSPPPPPIRMSPQCSSVPTSWTRKISLGSPTPSWCSTEAMRMEREFSGNTLTPLWGQGRTGCGNLPEGWLRSTNSLCYPGAPAPEKAGDRNGSQGSREVPWPHGWAVLGWWWWEQPFSQQCHSEGLSNGGC